MTIHGPVTQNPLQKFVTLEIWTLRLDCVQVFQAPSFQFPDCSGPFISITYSPIITIKKMIGQTFYLKCYIYTLYYFTGTFWSLRSNSSYSFEPRTLKFSTQLANGMRMYRKRGFLDPTPTASSRLKKVSQKWVCRSFCLLYSILCKIHVARVSKRFVVPTHASSPRLKGVGHSRGNFHFHLNR